MNGLKTASCLLKGRGCGETHVTLTQEMIAHWAFLVPSLSLSAPFNKGDVCPQSDLTGQKLNFPISFQTVCEFHPGWSIQEIHFQWPKTLGYLSNPGSVSSVGECLTLPVWEMKHLEKATFSTALLHSLVLTFSSWWCRWHQQTGHCFLDWRCLWARGLWSAQGKSHVSLPQGSLCETPSSTAWGRSKRA